MNQFKFFRGTNTQLTSYNELRWVDIEIDGYNFRIQTHHSSHVIGGQLRQIYRGYMRMWDDDMNRDRLLELLRERFADAWIVLNNNEIVNEEELNLPTNPSYYNLSGLICVGVTPTKWNPNTLNPYRFLVYENIDNGRMVTGSLIEYGHPMWGYNRQIDPIFYNAHYVDRNETI